MKKKIFGLTLVVIIVLSNFVAVSADSYFSGSGTEQDPYLIQTAADLTQLATLTNTAATGTTYAVGKYYKLTADIDMSGAGAYMPISRATGVGGSHTLPGGTTFKSTFDGDGHIIKNVTMTAQTLAAGGSTYGIIGWLGLDGVVKNLGVENITADGGSTATALCIGGIVGTIGGGTAQPCAIQNCYVRGMTVTATANGNQYVGGIVGRTVGQKGSINNCYATELSYTLANTNFAAGILGGCGNSAHTASNCYTTYSKIQGWATATNSYMVTTNCYTSAEPDSLTSDSLGAAFKENLTVKNDGLPVLSWESTEGYPLKQGAGTDPNFSGAGTEEEPFEIDSVQKLVLLATLTNDANQAKYASKYYKLTMDLDMTGIEYKPISYGTSMYTPQGARFTGTLDGDGHIIKNVNIPSANLSTYGATAGIIGILGAEGTVKNLGVEDMTVTTGSATYMCIGGISGSLMADMSIDKCYVRRLTVNGESSGTPVYVGGIVGRTIGNSGAITNCYSTDITFTLSSTSNSGGIIGSCGNTGYSAANCYTTDSKIQGDSAATNSYMGTTNCHMSVSPESPIKATLLGDSFDEDESLLNQGMPVLIWEYDIAHPETVNYTVKSNNTEITENDDIPFGSSIVIEFDRDMNTSTFKKISILKSDEVLDSDKYNMETVSKQKISITLTNAEYGARYTIIIPKTVQSEIGTSGKSAKADAKAISFRIETKPKDVIASSIEVNGDESWTPDFTSGTPINVSTNVAGASGFGTQSVALLVTVFSDGIMKYAALDIATVGSGSENLSVSFNMPEGLNSSNAKMYVMVWDSITKMNAMSVEKVFTSN